MSAARERTYWTIRQNWDGKLWPRLWPTQRFAWIEIKKEVGMDRRTVSERCDWTLVRVTLTEVPR